ncbi:UNVERIFIED_CONTAM: hypothetical protein FKN15_011050 [Acipenser sinensis]
MQGVDIDLGPDDFSEWDQRLPPPAAKEIVQNLPTAMITPAQADKGLKCPVCLLEFEEEETVRKMPCEHLFHSGCILPWLGKTNSCPLCRHEMPTENKEYEEFKKDKVGLRAGGVVGVQGAGSVCRGVVSVHTLSLSSVFIPSLSLQCSYPLSLFSVHTLSLSSQC